MRAAVFTVISCAHPPFQIDGNFGYTAGVAEMLVQSHVNEIHLLPALPKAWSNGSISGLKARGNFELLNLEWKQGKTSKVSVKSLSGGKCMIRSAGALKAGFKGVKTSKDRGEYTYAFTTVKGKTYNFSS